MANTTVGNFHSPIHVFMIYFSLVRYCRHKINSMRSFLFVEDIPLCLLNKKTTK